MTTGPAGWYPQPDGTQRYWDGAQWTEHTAPVPAPTPPPATGSSPTPAGWYPDAQVLGGQRYWDGRQWTMQRPPAGPSWWARRWAQFRGWPLWVQIVVAVVVAALFVAAGVSGNSSNTSGTSAAGPNTTPNTPTSEPSVAPTPTIDAQLASARKFIANHQSAIDDASAALKAVQTAAGLAAGGSFQAMVDFDTTCASAKNTFQSSQTDLGGADNPTGLDNLNGQFFDALGKFIDACDAAKRFLDSQKPSDAAAMGSAMQTGDNEWIGTLAELYAAAHVKPPKSLG